MSDKIKVTVWVLGGSVARIESEISNTRMRKLLESDNHKLIVRALEFMQYTTGDVLVCEIEESVHGGVKVVEGSIAWAEETERPRNPNDWIDVEGIMFSPQEYEMFTVAETLANNGVGYANIMARGPSGYGKTSRGAAWAKKTGRDHFEINVAVVTQPERWFGNRELRDGENTVFEEGPFAKALQRGNMLITIDEISRANPAMMNPLFSILDHRRNVVLTNGYELEVAENTVFFATINEGYKYTATDEIDAALDNRFGMQFVTEAPPAEIETKLLTNLWDTKATVARQIVNCMRRLRADKDIAANGPDISTRTARNVAEFMHGGANLRTALRWAIENHTREEGVRKNITDIINSEAGM